MSYFSAKISDKGTIAIDDTILVEKNMIAIENKNTLFAYGDSAFDMYEKAPANIVTSYPVCNGVIADIKQELRRAYALKINYAATQRTNY